MISIVIPAHNEADVIRRCLESFAVGSTPGELDIVVVCNGCSDDTAGIARATSPAVRVIETEAPSKTNALNIGDAAARSFPRIYMDADIVMSLESIRKLAEALDGDALAASPAVRTVFKANAEWAVRAYYAFWMALPFVQEGMMAAGVYAVSEEGRRRFDKFPDVIADDGFFRLHFAPHERVEVRDAVSTVTAPSRWADLIRIKTRSRFGVYQLRQRYADLYTAERQTKRYAHAIATMLRQPKLYACIAPFVAVSAISRARAQKQLRAPNYVWERDFSSRG